jgi:hypothetical protein
MYRAAVLVLTVIVFALNTTGCSDKISPQETRILEVLGEIQRGIEANIDYAGFEQSLVTAEAEIEMIKQDDKPNSCFQSAVEKSYASYEIARKAWKKKLTTKEENRKADLEMALTFSLSFSAINVERAKKCYR